MVLHEIQNLIFDLGGVILDLHVDRTHRAFAEASRLSVDEIKAVVEASSFFTAYEKGLLSDEEFRNNVRSMVKQPMTDEEIDTAWTAMLGGIPAGRLQLLKRLRSRYRIFLLSNTNSIHLKSFDRMVQAVSDEQGLHSFFEVAYYSNRMKMRKPDREIYDFVLHENGLKPGNTLFLDDYPVNLQGATEAGIKTFHVTHPDTLFSLFHEY